MDLKRVNIFIYALLTCKKKKTQNEKMKEAKMKEAVLINVFCSVKNTASMLLSPL